VHFGYDFPNKEGVMARKKHTARFKAKVAVEAIKEDRTIAELSSIHGVHRNMIQKWKSEAMTGMADIFSSKSDKDRKSDQELISELYRQIGQLTVENDWFKKNS
jgi:putative transposase|tara:strand:+ start:312 stop:623 length:312 start_codon:yes stop_codon:yes gene_type:complete